MRGQLAALLLAVAVPFAAEAGRRPFIWGYDAEIVPEGDVELEQWLWERSASSVPGTKDSYWVWWAPVIGLSDHFELAIPFNLAAQEGGPVSLESFEVDLRYRLLSRQSDAPFQPLLRVAYHEAISFGQNRVDANLVGTLPNLGNWHVNLDVGGRFGIADGTHPATILGTYDLGVAYRAADEINLAVEAFGEIPLQGIATGQHQFIGPSVEWTRGRFWITAGVLIGLTPIAPNTPYYMPRIIWAVAL